MVLVVKVLTNSHVITDLIKAKYWLGWSFQINMIYNYESIIIVCILNVVFWFFIVPSFSGGKIVILGRLNVLIDRNHTFFTL